MSGNPAARHGGRRTGPIVGDTTGALGEFTDTKPLFGDEIRGISAVDLQGGKAVRQVDYWDGRRNFRGQRQGPADQCPTDLGTAAVNGITVLELDRHGLITNLTTTWDASRTGDSARKTLAALAIKNWGATFGDQFGRLRPTRLSGRHAVGGGKGPSEAFGDKGAISSTAWRAPDSPVCCR